MKLGAHVSTAGGLDKAIDRAVEIGCEAIQIFGSSPQSWAFKPIPETQVSSFRAKAGEAGIDSVFFHAIYLINLGTADPHQSGKGNPVPDQLHVAGLGGGRPGGDTPSRQHKGAGYEGILRQTISSIDRVLENSPTGPWLTLENTAGMGQHIGAKLGELGGIIKGVSESHRGRVKVCLDTQHSFAAGYDIATGPGLEATLAEFDETIGLDNLVAVHANDSKYPLGAGVDRHENIGQGYLGLQTFENLMSNAAFRDLPFLLEVPGAEKKGPDKENLDILKAIRSRVAS